MSKPPNYYRKLARPITLADGTTLNTLGDAATLLTEKFSTVLSWGALENAIKLLMVAATSGKRADIMAATDAIEIVLRGRRLL
jgi:hypothetical protein